MITRHALQAGLRRDSLTDRTMADAAKGMAILCSARTLYKGSKPRWVLGWNPSHDIREGIGNES